MKNTVLHTKTTFSKSLNWILYIKNYEIQRKRCLSATYNNLYHYAGNNPVKYTDPTGMMDETIEDLGHDVTKLPNLYHKEFKQKVFTRDNPLNQLDLDKALGLKTDSKNTKSCQTTAMINAYAATSENGITGEEILNAIMNWDGSFKNLEADGSPTTLYSLSRSLAKSMGLSTYKLPLDVKIKPTLLANLKDGAILGWSENGKNKDIHFGYIDWQGIIDSLNPNRETDYDYTINSYRILIDKKL